jgi:hypothetical protein
MTAPQLLLYRPSTASLPSARILGGVFRPRTLAAALLVALAAAAAAIGWTRAPRAVAAPRPSIRIVNVRPLQTSDAKLRDLITHTFEVRVDIRGWALLPFRPGPTPRDNAPGAGHWRLYLDGRSLGDNFGPSHISYLIIRPGTHWLAAELSNADSTSVRPAIWSEPIILHVPRVVRCWQAGWHGTPERGTPRFACVPPAARHSGL